MSQRQQPSKYKQIKTVVNGEELNHQHGGYYRFCFRQSGQEHTAFAPQDDLVAGTCVMVETDHGPEPARIISRAILTNCHKGKNRCLRVILRRADVNEEKRYVRLPAFELKGLHTCRKIVNELKLSMHLVRVERYFNGAKIIFYFTAESRVDFRELVRRLVSEFRTRVEMRQIGVRHETQMLGGLGPCGREFCCTLFLKKFDSVSIKMAKAQDLSLNPAKISGVCNRLFCCLSYEYDNYRLIKKKMPKVGRLIRFEGIVYRVMRHLTLQGNIIAINEDREEKTFTEAEWGTFEHLHKPRQKKKKGGYSSETKSQTDTKGNES